jgi:hypothetical protein
MAVVRHEGGQAQASGIAEHEDRRLRRVPDDEPVVDLQHGDAR